jgi:hypothetical protein
MEFEFDGATYAHVFGGVTSGYSVNNIRRVNLRTNVVASHIHTSDLREEFIRAHVEGNPVTLKELAILHGRSYTALRKAASNGKWSEKAAVARAERDDALAERIAQQNAVTAALIEETVGREIDVRLRHAMLARSMQKMALERLVALNPSELSAKLAVEMLKAGVEGERVALGLGNASPNLCDEGDNNSRVREAVQEAMVILE